MSTFTPRNDLPSRPVLALLAVVAAGIGAATATIVAGMSIHSAQPAPLAAAPDLQQLHDRLTAIENRPLPSPATGTPANADHATRAAAPDAAIADLQRRLAAIEQRLADLAKVAPAPRATEPAAPAAEVAIPELRQKLLTATTEAEKLAAWSKMRSVEGSWDDATVAEMVRIGLTSNDASLRANVWRQADGLDRHDALVPAMLQAMASDPDAKVREEAAETIANYFNHPGVAAALAQAASNDADENVRLQAQRSIAEGEEQRRRSAR